MMDHVWWASLVAADLWAVLAIAGSGEPPRIRAVWIAGVALVPLAGFLAWVLYGPKRPREREGLRDVDVK